MEKKKKTTTRPRKVKLKSKIEEKNYKVYSELGGVGYMSDPLAKSEIEPYKKKMEKEGHRLIQSISI